MTDCTIPQGYKATPLGIIPQEWEVRRLGDLCCNQGDYGINAPAVAYSNDLPTYLRITDISDDGKFIIDNKASVNSPNSESYHLKEGDIVFARTGATVGKTYLYNPADGDLVFAGFLIRFSPNEQKIVPYYLKTYTNTAAYWYWVKIISQRSGQPGINAAEYSSLQLPVPPLAEQKKIAEVLGVWDKAIEKQSQLIEQLTLRKRGLMQQLLTAKRRLPGFSGRWEDVELGEVLTYEQPTPYIVRDTNYQNGYKTPVLTAGKTFILGYTNEDCGICNNIPVILFDDFTTDSRYIDFEFKVKSSAIKLLRVKGNDNLYFIYCALRGLKYVVGGHERHWISKFQYLTISLPSIEEQTAIAQVLIAADREIELAQQKLELLRQQKRGLMQQLLTGKKRVKY